ncbi:MAG: hypothetical protein PUP91_07805 [Rhizonema sp. PD37]|nr:hypothetical protein [Rhizonema sp. PD37]
MSHLVNTAIAWKLTIQKFIEENAFEYTVVPMSVVYSPCCLDGIFTPISVIITPFLPYIRLSE